MKNTLFEPKLFLLIQKVRVRLSYGCHNFYLNIVAKQTSISGQSAIFYLCCDKKCTEDAVISIFDIQKTELWNLNALTSFSLSKVEQFLHLSSSAL